MCNNHGVIYYSDLMDAIIRSTCDEIHDHYPNHDLQQYRYIIDEIKEEVRVVLSNISYACVLRNQFDDTCTYMCTVEGIKIMARIIDSILYREFGSENKFFDRFDFELQALIHHSKEEDSYE